MKLPDEFVFTQSNLQDYVDCPYRFYLKYFLRLKWPALIVDDAIDFELRGQAGARFHRLAHQYLLGLPEDRLSESASADPYPDIPIWWENFLTYIPPHLAGERHPELTLTASINDFQLAAKYDLVLVENKNALIIFDWKTSQKRPRKSSLLDRIQTRLYRYVLVRAGSALTQSLSIEPDQVSMRYWFANHPESFVDIGYDHTAYEQDDKFFTQMIKEIQEKEPIGLTRTDDIRKCRYCIYRSHCDRGTRAGTLDGFEEFELDPDDFELDFDFDDIAEIQF